MNRGIDFRRLQACLARVALVREPLVIFDLLLKLDDGIKYRFRRRRATRNVDVDWNDFVDALHHVIRPIETPARRARSHRDHPPWLSHLIVDLFQDRSHLIVNGAKDH